MKHRNLILDMTETAIDVCPAVGDTVSHFGRCTGWVVRRLPTGTISIATETTYSTGINQSVIFSKMVLTEKSNPIFGASFRGTSVQNARLQAADESRYGYGKD